MLIGACDLSRSLEPCTSVQAALDRDGDGKVSVFEFLKGLSPGLLGGLLGGANRRSTLGMIQVYATKPGWQPSAVVTGMV